MGCFKAEKYALTYKKDGDYVEFEMSGKSQWVALGFNSKEKSMVCWEIVFLFSIMPSLHSLDI